MKKLLLLLFITTPALAGLITHTDYVAGSVITAAAQNSNENAVFNEFNGNINNANILDGGIATADLADGLITKAKLGAGSLSSPSYAAKTADYALTSTDDIITSSPTTTNLRLTLPDASTNSKKVYVLRKMDTSISTLVIVSTGTSTDRIENSQGTAVDYYLATPGETITIMSNGVSRWIILHHYSDVAWTSYTPTFTGGWGTPVSINMYYRRVGEDLEVRGTFKTGTVSASSGTVSLPSGITMNSDKLTGSGAQYLGSGNHVGSSVALFGSGSFGFAWDGNTTTSSKSRVYFTYNVASNAFTADVVNGNITSGDIINIQFACPINNWNP